MFSCLHKCACPSTILCSRVVFRFLRPSHGDFVPVHVGEDGNFASPKAKKALEVGSPDAPAALSARVAFLRVRDKAVLPLAWWIDAWDGYAMRLAVTCQMGFRTAMLHKHWVLEVSSTGGDKAGPFYDELVRRVSLLSHLASSLVALAPFVSRGISLRNHVAVPNLD